MVPLHRIELQITDYKTVVIPFNYKGVLLIIHSSIKNAINLVEAEGFEPSGHLTAPRSLANC